MNIRRLNKPAWPTALGFTLTEVTLIIIIVAILSFFALPRFMSQTGFLERGYYEELLAALRYAHKRAIATRCAMSFTSNGSSYDIKQLDGCTGGSLTVITKPGGGEAFTGAAPSGVTLTAVSFSFSSTGAPSSGTTTITVSGGQTRNITVEGGTGYVH